MVSKTQNLQGAKKNNLPQKKDGRYFSGNIDQFCFPVIWFIIKDSFGGTIFPIFSNKLLFVKNHCSG